MYKNLPNMITGVRLLLIPVFTALYLTDHILWAIIVLAVVMLSDVLDGYIARKFDLTSRLGELLDPLADKLSQIMICVCLFIKHLLPLWFFIAIVLKELLMLGFGSVASLALKKNHAVSKAKWYGKVATVCLYTVICANFVFPDFFTAHPVIRLIGFCLALFWEYFAFINYGLIYLKVLRSGSKTSEDIKGENSL